MKVSHKELIYDDFEESLVEQRFVVHFAVYRLVPSSNRLGVARGGSMEVTVDEPCQEQQLPLTQFSEPHVHLTNVVFSTCSCARDLGCRARLDRFLHSMLQPDRPDAHSC